MSSQRTRLILLAVMIVAFCLATMQLGSKPLWFDEAVTFWRAQLSIPDMVENSIERRHTPFYFGVMKVWLSLGDSEFWLRFFSVLCFASTVPVVYVIGRTVGNRRAGLYAVALVITAPFLIRYAREARMYTLLTFFCSLALMSAALLISRQSDQPPPVIGASLRRLWRQWRGSAVRLPIVRTIVQGGGDDLLWLTYMVAVLGAMFTHNTAVLLPIVTTLIFLVAIAAAPQFRWLRLRNLIIANLIVLALYGFYVPGLLTSADASFARRPPTLIDFPTIERNFIRVYANEYLPVQALMLVTLCALALWGWRRRGDWRWVAFTLVGSLGLPLMLVVVSALLTRVFIGRVIIWTAIPLYVACGVGLARLPYAGLRPVVLAVFLLCNLYGVLNEYERSRASWDRITQTVAQAASSDGAVVLCPDYVVYPFNYYWRRHERELTVFGRFWGETVAPFLEAAHGEVSKWLHKGEKRDFLSLLDHYSELWIIERPSSSKGCDLAALRAALSERERLVEMPGFTGLRLFVYGAVG